MHNKIDSTNIKNFLINDLDNIDIYTFDSIDSTNTYLKNISSNIKNEFTTVVANEQTQGRGRLGRQFFSPANTGIYMSFIIKPDMSITDATFITTATSVAVCKAIENVTHLNPKIKWINDIYIENKKACGILAEAITDINSGNLAGIIIGIGINVNTTNDIFPENIKDIATALTISNKIDRNELIASILNEFHIIYNNPQDYMEDYKKRSLILNKDIYYIQNGIKYYGTAIDFTENGGLVIIDNEGNKKTLTSGEISVRLN